MTDDSNRRGVNRRQILSGVGVASAATLAGCTTGGDTTTSTTQTPMGGGKLNIAQAKSPIEFDPIVLNDVPSAEIVDQIVEGLYAYDGQTTNMAPELAAKMPEISNGGKRWVVPIKDGATFQNGNPVTAEDVKYSFEAPVKEKTGNASELNMIDTVEVVDDKTVEFNLKYPYGPFQITLGWYVIPKEAREGNKKAFNTGGALVGSGPFTFESWQQGQYTRITRWDDYWGEPVPNVSEIKFVPVKEPTTRVTSLKTGENSVIKSVPPKLWQQVKDMSDAGITATPGINYFYLAFNCNEGPTTDPEVREAIDYSFSMDQAVNNFVKPTGIRQYSPLPRATAESWNMPLDEWQQIPHSKDVDKAKSMLDGKVPSDWTAKIIVPPDDKREQIGLTVANGLKEVGYGANVQRLDWGAFLKKYITGQKEDYNMFTLGWSGSPDPDAFLYYLFHKSLAKPKNGTNGAYYTDDQVSQWIKTGRRTSDREKRREVYLKAIDKILRERPHIPAYGLKNSFGMKNYVNNFEAHPAINMPLVGGGNNVSLGEK